MKGFIIRLLILAVLYLILDFIGLKQALNIFIEVVILAASYGIEIDSDGIDDIDFFND